MNLKSFCYFVTVSYENVITFNCNYVYIKYFNHHFNFCVRKPFIIVPTMRYCKKLLLTFEIVVILFHLYFIWSYLTRFFLAGIKVYQKMLVKGIKIFPKKNNKKSGSIVVNNIKTFLNMEKGWLSIEKTI